MFSSNPLDKSCIGPDCSSGRSNASNRFPVGITSLGDESQQIRIQLAVHKYNSSASSPLNNRCGVISPYRHSFLSNSLKAKGYDGEAEGTSKSEKRNGNQYEGVGAFPTIHLKKSAVRYRPIRRYSDVKVSCPELPVNRFLSNLPEACADVKSSTRSVLDVLEDLSGKKIHLKDENGSNKPKSKGLGGDYLSNQNTVYKPLFVQKPKISTVLTRDNTTQTLSALGPEVPSPQSSNSFTRNDTSDPRAELRRKLAKQNNEIFASLSSSISSTFAVKRKLDKVTPCGHDDGPSDETSAKNPRIDNQPNRYIGNGVTKSVTKSKTSASDPVKVNRSRLKETNSPTSPNKDRLTTIYLDMQNTSRKAQIFENNSTEAKAPGTTASDAAETHLSNGFTHNSNGFSSNISTPPVQATNGTVDDNKGINGVKSSASLEKTDATDSKKPEVEQVSTPSFNFPVTQANTSVCNVTKPAVTFQFGVNTSTGSLSTKSAVESDSNSGETPKRTENDKPEESSNKSFTFGSTSDKPNFSSFKFGADNSTTAVSTSPKDAKTSETAPVTNTKPQFSFGATNATTSAPPNPFPVQFGIGSAQSTLTSPAKPLFTFGQNASPSGSTKPEEKTTVGSTLPTSIATTTQSGFKFGEDPGKSTTVVSTSQSTPITFTPSASSSPSTTATLNSKPVFAFGQKTDTTSTTSGTTGQESKFNFSFGQKPDVDQKVQEGAKSTNLFSFGQKSVPQETQSSSSVLTNVVSPSQPATTQPGAVFGQTASPPQMKFGGMSTPQAANTFGAKSETGTLGNMSTPTFSQSSTSFPIKTSLFGPSNSFGTSTTQALGTSTSSTPAFSFGASVTTQSTFGASSTSTPPTFGAATTFGSSSTTQATSFGTSVATTAFGAPVSTQSTFPASTTQTSFGVTSTTQSLPAFRPPAVSQSAPLSGIPTTTQSTSTFGVSSAPQSTPTFGASSTSQTTFTPSSGFGVPTSSQPSSVFGATQTQSPVRFGAPMAPTNTGFGASTGFSSTSSTQPTFGSPSATSSSAFGQPSFSQPFNNKPSFTPTQATSIFGQAPVPSFSSENTFNQSNLFGQKPNSEGGMFDQNKIQTPGFGATSQTFGNQNKFAFGMSTSSATGFTTSPPNTTSPVFSFGGSSTANTFTFGGGGTVTSNAQTPFAFKSPTSEPFKFGATTAKEGAGFGGSGPNFNFGGQMNNNNGMTEQKPAFSFGNTQVSSAAPFAFGTTPSPSVFSFGGSTSGSSGSSFNFGTPTPGGPFGQTPAANLAAPFPVPGTFSIGSGSSQSRPRATSRPRRRP